MLKNRTNSVIVALMLFMSQLVWVACTDSDRVTQGVELSIVFENINVIDAVNGIRTDLTVVITGNEIAQIGAPQSVEIPTQATVVDGKGKYLIPGLWDMHVHLTFIPELESAMFPLFLANGITSIRDTGGQIDKVLPWAEKSEAAPSTTPRVFIAGPLLDGLPRVYDGTEGRPDISVGAGTPEEAREIVDSLARAGVHLLKAYEILAPDTYLEVVKRAKYHGLPITGHIPLSMDIIEASSAGLSSMEHLRNLELACSSDADSLLKSRRAMLLEEADQILGGELRSKIHRAQRTHALQTQDDQRRQQVIQSLLTNNTWQIPTLTIVTSRVNRVYEKDSWRETFSFLPEPIRTQWFTTADQYTQQQPDSAQRMHSAWGLDMVRRLNDHGVVIMAGTDTPIALLTPGFSLHEELTLLAKAGLTPIQILEAATIRPAQYFGMEDKLGKIEQGMTADLVLLNANPLDDIANTQQIQAVMKDGHLFDRGALDALLETSKGSGSKKTEVER